MLTIFLSIFLIISGFLFFCFPNLVIKICVLIKKYFLNEKAIILYGKKVGLIIFLFGFLIMISKINQHYIKKDKYYLASKEFYNHNFKNSEKICIEILSVHPKNVFVLELLGKTYFAMGRYDLARNIFLKIKSLSPDKSCRMDKYLQQVAVSKKKRNKI